MAKKSAAANYDKSQLGVAFESLTLNNGQTHEKYLGVFSRLQQLKQNPPEEGNLVAALLILVNSIEIALKGVCSAQEATKTLNEIMARLHALLTEKDKDIEETRDLMQQMATSNVELKKALEQVEVQLAMDGSKLTEALICFRVPRNGELLWEITGYAQKKQEAGSVGPASMYSGDFYSGPYGYRMCARVYLNGDGVGKNTHLSVFFAIKKGKYDDILEWPFAMRVKFTLMSQNGGQHHSDAFRPDPSSSSFRKPVGEMNIASGCPMFCPHNEVEQKGFLKNDKIWLKITVGE